MALSDPLPSMFYQIPLEQFVTADQIQMLCQPLYPGAGRLSILPDSFVSCPLGRLSARGHLGTGVGERVDREPGPQMICGAGFCTAP